LKLLLLGGTLFLGRAIAEAALQQGHQVTLFTRGQHDSELFAQPGVTHIQGDRLQDLSALQGQTWDAVIDTSAYVPSSVRAAATLLAPVVKHYTFISSVSVFANVQQVGTDENAPVAQITEEQLAEAEQLAQENNLFTAPAFGDWYGALKARCEQVAEQAMPGRVLTIRPGLIVGPHDTSDRFTYWPRRVAQGGEVLAPGRPDKPVQFIDVRDLAEWTLHMVERQQTGIYNATGPDQVITMQQLLETCQQVSQNDATLTWLDDAFLLEQKAGPWMELPLWIPDAEQDMAGFMSIDIARALAAGLTFRPLAETVRATLDWDATRPTTTEYKAGMAHEKELTLLKNWHERH